MSEEQACKDEYDVIVVGGGAAGLSAGAMSAEYGLKVLVLESGVFGGLLTNFYPKKTIKNIPGFPHGITASTCAKLFIDRAAKHECCTLLNERVIKIKPKKETSDDKFEVITESSLYKTPFIVLATGSRPNVIGFPGEKKLSKRDRGVYYYAKEPEKYYGKKILVAGGGESAIDATHDLATEEAIHDIVLVHRRGEFRASDEYIKKLEEEGLEDKIRIVLNTEIKEILADSTTGKVRAVKLYDKNSGNTYEQDAQIVILAMGLVPNSEIYKDMGIETIRSRYVKINKKCETSIPGIYACGDITNVQALVVVAAAQGSIAANEIYKNIRSYPGWKPQNKPTH